MSEEYISAFGDPIVDQVFEITGELPDDPWPDAQRRADMAALEKKKAAEKKALARQEKGGVS